MTIHSVWLFRYSLKRGFHPAQRTQRTQRMQKKYVTNAIDTTDIRISSSSQQEPDFSFQSTTPFLRATAGTAIARLSHRNSVRPSVCRSVRPSVTRVDQAKTVQARIIKSSPSVAPKTLVSGSVTLFQKFHRVTQIEGPK